MAITGLVGFRCLTLRNGKWVSASRTEFVWDKPLIYSECRYCPHDKWGHVLIRKECNCGIHATIWPDEFIEYMHDRDAVGFLVEAIGHVVGKNPHSHYNWENEPDLAHTWKHTHGYTSSGVLVVGVVNWTDYDKPEIVPLEDRKNYREGYATRVMSRKALLMEQAAKFFGVDIMDYETARMVAKTMWERKGFVWPISENF